MPVQVQQQQQQQQASLSFNNNSSSKGGIINRYHASRNLREEWRRAFFKAMELDYDSWHDNDNDNDNKAKSSTSAAVGSGSGGNKKKTNIKMTLINLIPERTGSKSTDENNNNSNNDNDDDPWTATAREIHSNLSRMASWIQEKKWDYASVHMTNDEASLIQSTVTSFTATTANEIESLRKMVSSASSSGGTNNKNNRDLAQHKQGIVQILLEQLKVLVAEPFGRLQKQRSRAAVRIWQNPLQCKLEPVGSGQTRTTDEHAELDAALGFVDDGGARTDPLEKLRFYPTKPILRLQQNFERSYGLVEGETAAAQALVPRPKSRFRELVKKNKKRSLGVLETTESDDKEESSNMKIEGDDGEDSSRKTSTKRSRPNGSSPDRAGPAGQQHYGKPVLPVIPTPDQQQDYDPYYTTTSEAALEDESALLTALLQNSDLDSIQKMEESMVQITTLLSQFSDLVAEQQEHVSDIQDATRQAKSNVEKGQEELVSATERTQESRHYMATAIFAMGMLLLLFHWLRP